MAALSHRRNTALKFFVNGRAADNLYGLSQRVGKRISRYSQAAQRAQASLARRAQPVAKQEIRKVYGVKASTLNGRLSLYNGLRRKGDYIAIQASIRRLPLTAFGGAWGGRTTAGATASVLLGQRKTYTSAFMATVGWRGRSGGAVKDNTASRAIYVRQLRSDGRRYGRGPLRRLYGPSVFEMLSPGMHGNAAAQRVRGAVLSQLETYYTGELARQLVLELRHGQ